MSAEQVDRNDGPKRERGIPTKQVGLWQITGRGPKRLTNDDLALESQLESWIESDPELLAAGLTIIGRQLRVECGPIDLLAIDRKGCFVVVEIKRGSPHRSTIAQVIDYAECIATMAAEELAAKSDDYLKGHGQTLTGLLEKRFGVHQLTNERRKVQLYVVGTGEAYRLERVAHFLSEGFNFPINLVMFDVFALAEGEQVLVRELRASDADESEGDTADADLKLEALCRRADSEGVGRDFRRVCEAAKSFGLYPRLWKNSVMFTPQEMRSRLVFTVWAKPRDGKLVLYVSSARLSEFYGISKLQAGKLIGKSGWREMTSSEVSRLIQGYEQAFKHAVNRDAKP